MGKKWRGEKEGRSGRRDKRQEKGGEDLYLKKRKQL